MLKIGIEEDLMEKIIPSGLLFFYKNSKKPQKLLSFL